jgi:hypothetical protein
MVVLVAVDRLFYYWSIRETDYCGNIIVTNKIAASGTKKTNPSF